MFRSEWHISICSCDKLHPFNKVNPVRYVGVVATMVVLACFCKKLLGSTSKGELDEMNGKKETDRRGFKKRGSCKGTKRF